MISRPTVKLISVNMDFPNTISPGTVSFRQIKIHQMLLCGQFIKFISRQYFQLYGSYFFKNQGSLVVSQKAKKQHARHAHVLLTQTVSTNSVKFIRAIIQSSWVLPLSYYRTNTFLPYGASKLKINKLSGNFVKNQPFQLSWHLFFYLRLKLGCLAWKQFIFTRGLVATFILCRINEPNSL